MKKKDYKEIESLKENDRVPMRMKHVYEWERKESKWSWKTILEGMKDYIERGLR